MDIFIWAAWFEWEAGVWKRPDAVNTVAYQVMAMIYHAWPENWGVTK